MGEEGPVQDWNRGIAQPGEKEDRIKGMAVGLEGTVGIKKLLHKKNQWGWSPWEAASETKNRHTDKL